eukprot:168636_1
MPTMGTNGLSAEQKQYQVDRHNFFRGKVAKGEVEGANGSYLPKAAKMSPVVWDNTLSTGAQNWASQCQYKHDTGVWESIAIAANVEKLGVDYWFGEINIYNYGDASTSSNGHLLSIIQQDLTKIGCGYSLCSYGPWLVCRYQPSGETFSSPYTISSGETGSQCVNGVNSESGLCK